MARRSMAWQAFGACCMARRSMARAEVDRLRHPPAPLPAPGGVPGEVRTDELQGRAKSSEVDGGGPDVWRDALLLAGWC